jgi:AAHS family benzoate transporter-like MFS transporter
MAFQSPASAPARPRKSAAAVIFLCFLAIVFDGYDLVVYGAIVPKLLAYEPWGLTPVQTGAIGSYALAGMFMGAIFIGYLTDIVGRRKVMMVSIAAFSLLMLLTAWAPTPELFGLFRFLAGLGLGGVIPTAIALTVEFSKSNRRNFNNALMFSGYAVGGILAAPSAAFHSLPCSLCCTSSFPSPRPSSPSRGTGHKRNASSPTTDWNRYPKRR